MSCANETGDTRSSVNSPKILRFANMMFPLVYLVRTGLVRHQSGPCLQASRVSGTAPPSMVTLRHLNPLAEVYSSPIIMVRLPTRTTSPALTSAALAMIPSGATPEGLLVSDLGSSLESDEKNGMEKPENELHPCNIPANITTKNSRCRYLLPVLLTASSLHINLILYMLNATAYGLPLEFISYLMYES